MTNEEIRNIPNQKLNEMVTRILHDAPNHQLSSSGVVLYRMDNSAHCGIDKVFIEDYCSDAGLTWSLILNNKIDINHRESMGVPCAVHGNHMYADRNLSRAVVVVFLKLKGVL